MAPDFVIIGGDLTAEGYANEFRMAQPVPRAPVRGRAGHARHPRQPRLQERGLPPLPRHVRPGRRGRARATGSSAGRRLGRGDDDLRGSVTLVAIDSSKPDLAEGEVGRERYAWIREQFSAPAALRIFALHHHLVPVPGTGRERNTVWDSGDVLSLLGETGVDLVLSGHKHVPLVWLLNDLLLVNSGTVSSHRLRGYVRPSYNLLEVTQDRIVVTLRYPGTGERHAAELDRRQMRLHSNPDLAGMFAKSAWHA